MAHFAYVVDGVVCRVEVLVNEVMTDSDGVEQELLGQEFLAGLYAENAASFIQCSYNANFRGLYPGPGYSYDPVADIFTAPEVPNEVI
jgi:hypothetical protein